MCHLGVIDVLENAGIHIDRIAGTSAGALLGAMYATGYDAEELDAANLRGVRAAQSAQ